MKILHTADWHLGTFRSPVIMKRKPSILRILRSVPLMVRMEQERAVCSWMPLSTASMKNQERE